MSGQNVEPDLGLYCLKGLSADDNVMFKFNAKLKYIGSPSTCHNLLSVKQFNTYQVQTECRAWSGANCLKGLSADDNVMLKFNPN